MNIACSLTADELPARRERIARLGRHVAEVQERTDGYAYRFSTDSVLPELIEIVRAERLCCPFIRFVLTLEADNGPLWLEVSGPEGTKKFLIDFLQSY
ncbi:MAG: hypothetical protein NVSMB6_31940 [Burkholderiaceae bacterium]